MKRAIHRRKFLFGSAGAASILLARGFPSPLAAEPGRRIAAGVMGLGRGMDHVESLLSLKDVEVAYVCDVDSRRLESGVKLVEKKGGKAPQGVKDFRRILDDPKVDVLTIAAPNFWHAPAAILACAAGKHVYVEKPGSHNAREGELLAEAARKHGRIVQLGTQRRSQPGFMEGIEKARGGAIGPVRFARTWYSSLRPSIGRGKEVPVPDWLDYDLWEGPVPHRPYKDNLVHYNWHWMWHWGGGELANNGVHALDLVRWGLGADFPSRVTMNGGRYRYDDDQETPDASIVVFGFGGEGRLSAGASWDASSCHPRTAEKLPIVAFYGDGGTIAFDDKGYRILDLKGNEIQQGTGEWKDVFHFQNFLDAIRDGKRLNAPIEDGWKSALLCHLGNIAYRTGRTMRCDPATGRIAGDDEASRLFWGREYRQGWEPKV